MVDALINLLILVLIFGVVWWAVMTLLPLIPLPPPVATVVRVLLVVIFAIALIYALVPLLHVGSHGLLR